MKKKMIRLLAVFILFAAFMCLMQYAADRRVRDSYSKPETSAARKSETVTAKSKDKSENSDNAVHKGGGKPESSNIVTSKSLNKSDSSDSVTAKPGGAPESAAAANKEDKYENETPAAVFERKIRFDAEFPFIIKINRAQNWTIVYGMDKRGYYSVPYKIFLCSTGLRSGYTPTGTFSISDKYDWRLMVDGSYAQYAIRIYGSIMLHSVPYYSQNKDDLEVKEYNRLGKPASLGCVRYNVESIRWIYKHCPAGTKVVIYDAPDEKPLLTPPKLKRAKASGKKAGWDPTDPDKNNPWKLRVKKKNKPGKSGENPGKSTAS